MNWNFCEKQLFVPQYSQKKRLSPASLSLLRGKQPSTFVRPTQRPANYSRYGFVLLNSWIYIQTICSKPGHKVIVIDAGDSTVDISAYTVKSISPLEVEEFMEPQCDGPPDIWHTILIRNQAPTKVRSS